MIRRRVSAVVVAAGTAASGEVGRPRQAASERFTRLTQHVVGSKKHESRTRSHAHTAVSARLNKAGP